MKGLTADPIIEELIEEQLRAMELTKAAQIQSLSDDLLNAIRRNR